MKFLKSWMLKVSLFFCFTLSAQSKQPPPPDEVYQNVNALWESKEFDLIHQYLDDVLSEHPGYIPAMVAEIGRLKIDGAQYAEASKLAQEIENLILTDPIAASPGFFDLFTSYAGRLRETAGVYSANGFSAEDLRDRVKIEKHWRPNSSWKQELLFLSMPFARNNAGKMEKFETQPQIQVDYSELEDSLIREKLFDLKISHLERRSLAAELAQRAANSGIVGIVDALSHPTAIMLSEHLVEFFWVSAEEIPDKELLAQLRSNDLVLEKCVLWILANAPPASRFRAENLMSEYVSSLTDPLARDYGEILKEAMIRQSREIKHGESPKYDNGGRPRPDDVAPFRRASSEKSLKENFQEEATPEKKSSLPWIIAGVLLVGILALLFKVIKGKSTS